MNFYGGGLIKTSRHTRLDCHQKHKRRFTHTLTTIVGLRYIQIISQTNRGAVDMVKNIQLDKYRLHHYGFAHEIFLDFTQCSPDMMYTMIASGEPESLIEMLWGHVCERYDESQETDIDPSGIKTSIHQLGSYPTVLIEMPKAKGMLEAIMIAVVLSDYTVIDNRSSCEFARYFVLELTQDATDRILTMLCEWSEGQHLNYGEGPEADVGDFLNIVKKLFEDDIMT